LISRGFAVFAAEPNSNLSHPKSIKSQLGPPSHGRAETLGKLKTAFDQKPEKLQCKILLNYTVYASFRRPSTRNSLRRIDEGNVENDDDDGFKEVRVARLRKSYKILENSKHLFKLYLLKSVKAVSIKR
jgi:hypothetical protein